MRLGPPPTPSRLWAEARGARVSAVVLDALGHRVVTVPARAGVLEADLPTDGLAAGVYVVRVTAEHADGQTERSTRLLTVVR